MNETEIEKKLDELGKEIPELIKEVETYKATIEEYKAAMEKLKAEVKKTTFERVEKGEKYYFKNNNYFLTKERAEEVADKINFLLKLERLHDIYCPDYEPDWEDGKDECKWFIRFDAKNKEYLAFWTTIYRDATVYFDSKETAKKVCEILNKEIEK